MNRDRVDLWEVYDSEGEILGSIRIEEGRSGPLPWSPRLQLVRATLDEVWGVTLDEFDVPYLHRLRVDRSCQ